MSLTRRLALASLLPVGILGAVILYHAGVVGGLVEDLRRLGEIDVALSQRAVALKVELARLDELVAKAAVLDDPEYAREARRAEAAVDREVAALAGAEIEPAERPAVDAVVAAWRSRGSRGSTAGTRSAVDGLLEVAARTATERVEAGVARAERARRAWWGAGLLGIAAAVGLSGLLGWSVARPIMRLRLATGDLAEGDFARRVEPGGPPEIASLGEDFNRMAVRLGEIDRLKEDLLSNVSHELKAPLASMQETVRLVLDGLPGPLTERQEELLRLAVESGDRLSGVVENLLDLSRLQAGAMGFEHESVDLGGVVRRVVAPYEVTLRERGLDVRLEAPDDPPRVVCDASRIGQVVDNLLSNAVKFSPEGATIRVRVEPLGEGARIVVEDEGPGIDDAAKPRVFERFFRVDLERKGSQGTGLGLAIAREIAVAHGGSLEVEDADGGGSAFVLDLPPEPVR